MKPREKKKAIDALVEGQGGELVFRPVKASKNELHKLAKESKNPVIKYNVFKQGTNKKVKV
jgi:hypothetical protein